MLDHEKAINSVVPLVFTMTLRLLERFFTGVISLVEHEGPLTLHHLPAEAALELGVAVPQHMTLDLKTTRWY